MNVREIKYQTNTILINTIAFTGIVILVFLTGFIVKESIPALTEVGGEMFTSIYWYPTSSSYPEFGIMAMVAGSLMITGLTSLFVIPLGYIIAFFLYEYATDREVRLIKSGIDLLSGVPSVIIGAFMLVYITPWSIKFGIYSPENILMASIGLTILSLPFTASLMQEAMQSVNRSMKEGALALGATRFTAGFKIVSRAALSGILNAVILTVNRIIGETMVVLMVAGGAAIIPESLFDPAKPLTAAIASEMGEVAAGSIHYSALFVCGLILLAFSFALTLTARLIIAKNRHV
ncbi:MAG TPA: PstC family ABC transporter permease [Thermotogota bacterium]|nr:PstC family ABC transporter permease [Thermotogota bacterium]HPJ89964.1 PstC family ABC transporter permease [Thermotogota bacterium]HPR97035.1 PstC family ABC transporter permease [Thermotogota bacterium]